MVSKCLIVIVGPTAVGKTQLALRLCEEFRGEVVSADSRQIYRGMDIGTAKPTAEERRRVPHHLIDLIEPDEGFTLVQYQEKAYEAIDEILSRGRLPFLVGGTGLYVKALVEGFSVPRVKPDMARRRALLKEARERGAEALHARLKEVDPTAAARIDPRNVRRVIRALEVYEATGQPISQLQRKEPPPYSILKIGLTMERKALYRRIDERVDRMMEMGLLEEVKRLVERGYGYHLPAMSGLGYKQLGLYLRGEVDLAEAVRMIKSETRRFVRQQYKWFRLDDETINWIEVDGDPYLEARSLLSTFLEA
ncbi:MAG: tRNA (adenosine(37)-N6)-dimethylallyltransferase MiaA [Anaerolineae bacterium]